MIKKVIRQGRSHLDERSVLPVREHGKMVRTPLVAFFSIPLGEKKAGRKSSQEERKRLQEVTPRVNA